MGLFQCLSLSFTILWMTTTLLILSSCENPQLHLTCFLIIVDTYGLCPYNCKLSGSDSTNSLQINYQASIRDMSGLPGLGGAISHHPYLDGELIVKSFVTGCEFLIK